MFSCTTTYCLCILLEINIKINKNILFLSRIQEYLIIYKSIWSIFLNCIFYKINFFYF